MKNVILKITENKQLSKDIFILKLEGDLSEIKNPGEFVEIKLDNYYLRRPISVHDFTNTSLTLLFKVLGRGTKDLSLVLKAELKEAMNEKKNNILKNGGQISTKLLGPMVIMLVISIVIIMVPAFMSMGF